MAKKVIESNKSQNKKLNKKPSKLCKTIRFFLSVTLILVVGYAVLNYVPFVAKYDSYVIATGSMDPVIGIRDVVIIDTSVSIDDLEEGQIIAFYADIDEDGQDDVVVHYLYSISYDGDARTFRTKPEVSDQLDEWILEDEDIIGLHVKTIRNIGSLLMFATSTIGRIVLVVDIVVIYLLIELFSDNKEKKDKDSSKKENVDSEESNKSEE